ncbi:MAG TPA: SMI1/KNR4 family protein [Luteibacter sp.]|jgi:hypothetical protein|uniref:SMI1/KNR4 family protein n=1 Tax=Luteibacter sp. TaxID=1886636 RepID=UPI002F409108
MKSDAYLQEWGPRALPSEAVAALLNERSLAKLPDDYRRFMMAKNGGEGFVGESHLILWSVEELASNNREYEIQDYAAGLFLFGSNGGGEAFGFDMRDEATSIVTRNSKDGTAVVMTKDKFQYTFYSNAESTGGPSASIKVNNQEVAKIRFDEHIDP